MPSFSLCCFGRRRCCPMEEKKDDPYLTQFDLVHLVSNCVASAVVLVMLRELEQVLGGNLI